MPELQNDELLTPAEIGARMERSGEGVRKAIIRLGIEHSAQAGRHKFYPARATIARLEKDMRAKNSETAAIPA